MKKVLLSVCLVAVVVGGVAWSKRIEILLAAVKYTSATEYDVAENRPIPWQQGPVAAAVTDGEQPPNIILIVADDLGFNDISTFGGGVAGGQLKTPGIDRQVVNSRHLASTGLPPKARCLGSLIRGPVRARPLAA